jgi:hypothetical protein
VPLAQDEAVARRIARHGRARAQPRPVQRDQQIDARKRAGQVRRLRPVRHFDQPETNTPGDEVELRGIGHVMWISCIRLML